MISIEILFLQYLWQAYVAKNTRCLVRLTLILTSIAIVVDTTLIWTGVVTYRGNLFAGYLSPPWIIVLWLEFSLIVQSMMDKLWNRPVMAGIFAFFGFGVAYLAGERSGAAVLNFGPYSFLIISVIWTLLLPVVFSNHAKAVNQQFST